MERALIKPERGMFYCWRRDTWQGFAKYKHCVRSGCRAMEVTPVRNWKQRLLGGVLVPVGGRAS